MRKFKKILFAFLAVILLSVSFSVHALAAGEKTGTTTITAIVPDPAGMTCTVSFDANGGTGTMAPVTVEKGTEYTLPANGFTAPGGKVFDKWDKGAVGTKITVNEDVTIKAQWKDKEPEPGPGYDFKFTFTKSWEGDHEDSIDWVLYNPDGTVAHKKFNKKIVSENEWRYEAWFSTDAGYYIVETVPAGYKAVYENVGAHAGETDRCYNGGKIINYKLPKTGDPADLRLWTGMALMGLGVACGAVMIGRRKKAQR